MTDPLRCGALALLLWCLSMAPAAAVMIELQPSMLTVEAGQSFDLDVVVSELFADGEIVSAFDFDFAYDPAVLAATAVTFGTLLETDPFFGPGFSFQDSDLTTAGRIDVGELSLVFDEDLALAQPDSFSLLTISFDALAAGVTDVSFLEGTVAGVSGVDLKGRDAAVIANLTWSGAQITVEEPVAVPAPASLWLMLGGLAAGWSARSRRTR